MSPRPADRRPRVETMIATAGTGPVTRDGSTLRFDATLFRPEGVGTSTFVKLPAEALAHFATRARVPVAGTIQGVAFRGSFAPMGGAHVMVVNATLRAAAKVEAGDTASLVIQRDPAPRVVELPEDVARALAKSKRAAAGYAALSYSHQKEYVGWITGAKKAETRASRLERALGMLADGRKSPLESE